MKIIKNNLKVIVAFILGLIISGTGVYAATILFQANEVSYNNTSSGLTSTTVQGALDELNTKASTWLNPNNVSKSDLTKGTYQTNTTGRVFAKESDRVCILRKGNISCLKWNNWNEEKTHIKQIFSDITCSEGSSPSYDYVHCNTSDFYCHVHSYGDMTCYDYSNNSYCNVDLAGSVSCT